MGAVEVERKVTSNRKDLRQLMQDARSIFTLSHIPDVVYLVFDSPIAPNALSKGFH